MQSLGRYLLPLLLAVLLYACGRSNAEIRAKVDGPCEACPAERLDTLLKHVKGVNKYKYDPSTMELYVSYDSSTISTEKLYELLNDAGYGTIDYPALFVSRISSCCKSKDGLTLEDEFEEDENADLREMDEMLTGGKAVGIDNSAFVLENEDIDAQASKLESSKDEDLLDNGPDDLDDDKPAPPKPAKPAKPKQPAKKK